MKFLGFFLKEVYTLSSQDAITIDTLSSNFLPMNDTKITLVAATNRQNALSTQVAGYYTELLQRKGCDSQLLKLTDLPADFTATLYEKDAQPPEFKRLCTMMEEAQKYIFIIPEYNGSFPGVFKAFLDGLHAQEIFKGKKCAMVGVSQSPQGALFAMSHLTDIFHYLKMHVHPLKPKLGGIHDSKLQTVLNNERYVRMLEEQAEEMIKY